MKKILQIFSVFILSCTAILLFGVIKPQHAHAGGPVNCLFDNTDNPTAQNSMWLSCGTDPMVYDVERSLEHGTPTFVAYKSNGNAADGFIEYRGVNCAGTFGVVAYQNNQLVQTDGKQACRTVRNPEKFNVDPNNIPGNQQPLCSMKNTSSGCKVWDGSWSLGGIDGSVGEIKDGYAIGRNSPNGVFIGGAPGYNVVLNPAPLPAVNATSSSKTVCVDSPLSFFLCPLSDFVTTMVTGIFKAIQQLLIAPSLTGDSGPNSNLANAVGAMKNIANSAYGVLFLIIIIGNFIAIPGLDNYTIKKLLPRLIFVVVVTQFAFLICSIIIDFGNVLGFIVPSAIATAYNGNKAISASQFIAQSFNPLVNLTSGNTTQIVAGLAEGIGLWFFGFAFAVIALVVAIIGFCYLIFRYFALIVLVVISPIALAAFVLPNTVSFTTWWIKNFLKMVLIYPLVMLLFVVAAIAADIFGKSSSFLGPLIAAAMPLVALLIVPKIFKWSGGLISSAGKIIGADRVGKAASGVAKNAVKNSAKEGGIAELKGSALEKFGQKLPGTRGIKMEARGKQLKKAPKDALRDRISTLGIERQMELQRQGGKVGAAAGQSLTVKRRELLNTRALDTQQAADLQILNGNVKTNARGRYVDAPDGSGAQLYLDKEGKVSQVIDGSGNTVDKSTQTYLNPAWAGSPSSSTGSSASPPSPTGSTGGGAGAGAAPGGGGGGRPAPAAAPGGTGTSGTATPGTGAGPGQARSSAAQFNRGARAGRAATGSSAAPLSNPNATPPPNPAGGPPGGGGAPPAPPAGPPPGFPGP